MTKHIDADELKDWVENWLCKNAYYHPHSNKKSIPVSELYDIVEQMPTVDAVPVEFVKESIEILKFNGMLSGALLFETLLNDWKANTERKEE